MPLEFSEFVEEDLEAIAEYIAEDSPERAIAFLKEIGKRFREVAKWPLLYQVRPEIGAGARIALLGRYAILFRVIDETVRIERVVYGGRDLGSLLDSIH